MGRAPRIEAIHRGWRAIGPGVEALSTPAGSPLSRTVKLIVVPLVIRPAERPHLAGSVLGAEAADELVALIGAQAQVLRDCAAWFTLLTEAAASWQPSGQVTRDGCHAAAYELAVVDGQPGDRADDSVQAALAELADRRGEQTSTSLQRLLQNPEVVSELSQRLEQLWNRAHSTQAGSPEECPPNEVGPELLARCVDLLDGFAPGGGWTSTASAGHDWEALVSAQLGSHGGHGLVRNRWPHIQPGQAQSLGLTSHSPPRQPPLTGPQMSGQRPWDRPVAVRVAGVLRRTPDREVLPELTTMLDDEVERVTAPWQLLDEGHRLILLLAVLLCAQPTTPDGIAQTRAHAIVTAMRRRESWLLWAQRQPDSVDDDLTDPVGPFLRRLWVRLHGAESRGLSPTVDEVPSIIVGAVRSALLDGRSRVRTALTRQGSTLVDQGNADD